MLTNYVFLTNVDSDLCHQLNIYNRCQFHRYWHTINISDFLKVWGPMLEVISMEMRQNIGEINRATQVPLLVTCVVLSINKINQYEL